MMVITALIANAKNRNPLGWAFAAIPLGLVASVIVACLRKRPEEESPTAALPTSRTKTCPRCAETVKAAAGVCRFCGHEFGPQPTVVEPELPWEMVQDFGSGYGVFSYKNQKLTWTNRGVKWKGSTYDNPAQAMGAVDSYY
jgi:hypothetical protein